MLAGDQSISQHGALNAFHKNHVQSALIVVTLVILWIDRCYKLHGYPVGWKKGTWGSDKSKTSAVVANVSAQDCSLPMTDLDSLVGQLNKDQIQNFIAYFSSQLQVKPSESSPVLATQRHDPSGITFSSSTFSFVGILSVANCVTDSHTWIIDSGATHHVSHDRSAFTTLDTSVHLFVNLPNGSTIKVGGINQIVLSLPLTL